MLATLLVLAVVMDGDGLPVQTPQWIVVSADEKGQLVGELVVGSTQEKESRDYEVKVPYTTVTPDGSQVTAFQTVTKTRQVTVEVPLIKTVRWKADEVGFMNPNGESLSFEKQVKGRLAKPIPAILVNRRERVPAFAALLKEDALIIIARRKE